MGRGKGLLKTRAARPMSYAGSVPLGGDSTLRTALRRLGKPGMANHHGGGELLGVAIVYNTTRRHGSMADAGSAAKRESGANSGGGGKRRQL